MLASGRLCEMVGSKALDVDRFVRQLGLLSLAMDDAQHLKAYAQGINWYAGRCAKSHRLPLEFQLTGQPWEEWTVATGPEVGQGKVHALLRRSLAELLGSELAQLWTQTSEEEAQQPSAACEAVMSWEIRLGSSVKPWKWVLLVSLGWLVKIIVAEWVG
eukprot:Skav212113  [mRNA]  locus=scaffold4272:188963:193348:+ [translate_table: standard]